MIATTALPATSPTTQPMPICCRKNSPRLQRLVCGAVNNWMNKIDRKIAVGSFSPDSAVIVAASDLRMLCPPITAKTAAASVEPTIEPNSIPSSQEIPNR